MSEYENYLKNKYEYNQAVPTQPVDELGNVTASEHDIERRQRYYFSFITYMKKSLLYIHISFEKVILCFSLICYTRSKKLLFKTQAATTVKCSDSIRNLL